MGDQSSIPFLWNLCSESVSTWKLHILVEADTDAKSLITFQIECLFAFQFWYVNFVWKTNEGEAKSLILLI